MQDFYTNFYAASPHSQAHHLFCEKVFGLDLCQHGFADLDQLNQLIKVTGLCQGQRALDLGCGNGLIAGYLSDRSGAHLTGLDYIPQAIEQARQRTADRAARLDFMVGDINHLELAPASFDVILSIDSIYFSDDYEKTIAELTKALRPGGQMAFFYSIGREPWVPLEKFDRESIQADRSPLAKALEANGLRFHTWNLTDQDAELAEKRKTVLAELKPQFEAEGNLFIYENRLGDAHGISQAIAEGLHARYLYQAVRRGRSPR